MNIQFKYGYDFIGYNAPAIVIPSGSVKIFHHRCTEKQTLRYRTENKKGGKKKKETKIYTRMYMGCSTLDKKNNTVE